MMFVAEKLRNEIIDIAKTKEQNAQTKELTFH